MADEYIGSCISLISKYEIRYEGVLCHLSPQDSTLALKNVKSYGTEGRKKDGPQIPPGDKVYEYILFRGSDIKDLHVKSSQPTKKEEQVPDDPAIIQSQSSAGPSSSLKSDAIEGEYSASFSSFQKPITSANPNFPSTGPLYQSGILVEPGSSSMAVQSTDLASLAAPSYTPGYNGIYPRTLQNIQVSTPGRGPYLLGDSTYSVTLDNYTPAPFAEQYSLSSNISSSLPASVPASPLHSSYPDISASRASALDKSAFDSVAAGSVQSSPFLSSSIPDSRAVLLPKLQPTLPTLNYLRHPRQPLPSSTPFTRPDEKYMFAFNPVSANLSSLVLPTLGQQLPLPLPLSMQQPQHSLPEYTEEFDFEAMNEKFKKEEVWDYLGRAKQRVDAEGTSENAISQHFGHGGGYVSASKPEPNPAYKKDDFFDTLSGNVHARAPRNVQNRFPERMKYNTETFGNFGQIPYQGRGFYHHGRGRGWNYPI